MTDMQCTVCTPCGRYKVHLVVQMAHASQTALIALSVRSNARSTVPYHGTRHSHYTATLDEAQVAELTSSAGVRKSFRNFAEMMYNGLIGTAPCVTFYVETVAEMKRRITTDIRTRRGQHSAHEAPLSSAQAAGESHTDSVQDDETSDSLVHLSIHSDTAATQAREQRFLTVDYNVDFTRAVFPIPLTLCTVPDDGETPAGAEEEVIALSGSDDDGNEKATKGVRAHERGRELAQAQRELATTRAAMVDLQARNTRLEKENRALQDLCKEKMLTMQDMCDRFQDHAELVAEVERLRRKNTELRLRMRAAEEGHAEAEKRLLGVMDARRQPSHSPSLAARRDSSPSPRPTVNTRLSSPSREAYGGCATAHRVERRGLSADPTRDAGTRQRRRPLVSPTPPSLSARRRSQERGAPSAVSLSPAHGTHSSRGQRVSNRFDTPPDAAMHARARRRAERSERRPMPTDRLDVDFDDAAVSARGGGDAPAPRGRTGARPSPSRSPSLPSHTPFSRAGSMPSVYKTAARGRALDEVRSDTHSRCSSVSSRASSVVSERLFRATTASTRQRQDAIAEDVRLHKDPGRLDYHHQERTTPSRRRAVFR